MCEASRHLDLDDYVNINHRPSDLDLSEGSDSPQQLSSSFGISPTTPPGNSPTALSFPSSIPQAPHLASLKNESSLYKVGYASGGERCDSPQCDAMKLLAGELMWSHWWEDCHGGPRWVHRHLAPGCTTPAVLRNAHLTVGSDPADLARFSTLIPADQDYIRLQYQAGSCTDLARLKVDELKIIAKTCGVPTPMLKAELINNISLWFAAENLTEEGTKEELLQKVLRVTGEQEPESVQRSRKKAMKHKEDRKDNSFKGKEKEEKQLQLRRRYSSSSLSSLSEDGILETPPSQAKSKVPKQAGAGASTTGIPSSTHSHADKNHHTGKDGVQPVHNSKIANQLDPRVDSDRVASK